MADLSSYIYIAANTVTAANVSATGNVVSNSAVSTTGNVTAGNIISGGVANITGNITGANLIAGSGGAGNVYAGNVIVNGQPTTYGVANLTTGVVAVQATATGTVAATVVANTSPVSGTNFNGGSSASPSLTVMTVAIPGAGTWRLDAEMRVYIPGEGYMAAGFYNNGTLISGSEYFIAAGGVTQTGAATGQYGGFMSYNLTTTGATTVTMGAWATGTSQFITSDDGRTWLRATQIDSIFALNTLATMSVTGNVAANNFIGNVVATTVSVSGNVSVNNTFTFSNIAQSSNTTPLAATDTTIAFKVPIVINGVTYYIALTAAQ
jgi:hypothetical protein